MISLKKYLDMDPTTASQPAPAPNDLFLAMLESYRAVLLAMGNSGVKSCPGVGSALQHALSGLERRFFGKLTVSLVKETENEVEEELRQWAESAAEYFQTKANEVKELLIVLAGTAESMGQRDQRYESHFCQMTAQLNSIADLDDLAHIRMSLVKQAAELKTYVEKMAQESRNSVAQLQAEVTTYEGKLKAVQQIALKDSLTGMANRRYIEDHIESCIAQKVMFCIVILDLDQFKQVNDSFGHLAGDNLLQQFSHELLSNVRSTDRVGRWGGDEFIAVLDCNLSVAKSQIERVQKWVLGEYTIKLGAQGKETKVTVSASIGLAQWQSGETMQQLIARADSTMYREKHQARSQRA